MDQRKEKGENNVSTYSLLFKFILIPIPFILQYVIHVWNKGGEMIELMRVTGGFHSVDDMVHACSQPGGMSKLVIDRMNEKLKGT